MNVNNVKLLISAVAKKQYPNLNLPEIAFVGRSNVGKSSLINRLINRKSLARVSGVPGKTITINFYDVENKLIFVDLPGYGFAKRSKEEIRKWGNMIEEYLITRNELKLVLMLVDIRHKPSEDDVLMYNWLCEYNVPTKVIATKLDKIKKSQIEPSIALISETLGLEDSVIAFSSLKGDGKDETWSFIENTVLD